MDEDVVAIKQLFVKICNVAIKHVMVPSFLTQQCRGAKKTKQARNFVNSL